MRKALLVLSLAVALAGNAQAQNTSESTWAVAQPPEIVRPLSDFVAAGQRTLLGPIPTRRCCSAKGAVIGAAIGAAVGFGFATLCDAGDCTSGYIKYMTILGGVGAGIGVMTAHPTRRVPFLPGVSANVVVAPVVFRGTYEGVLAVRF